jgi:hypothetical protein
MTYKLIFRQEVEEDAIAGYLWYEKKAVGLGEEFLTQFYKYTSDIPRKPNGIISRENSETPLSGRALLPNSILLTL